jgi:hypothetical protein
MLNSSLYWPVHLNHSNVLVACILSLIYVCMTCVNPRVLSETPHIMTNANMPTLLATNCSISCNIRSCISFRWFSAQALHDCVCVYCTIQFILRPFQTNIFNLRATCIDTETILLLIFHFSSSLSAVGIRASRQSNSWVINTSVSRITYFSFAQTRIDQERFVLGNILKFLVDPWVIK